MRADDVMSLLVACRRRVQPSSGANAAPAAASLRQSSHAAGEGVPAARAHAQQQPAAAHDASQLLQQQQQQQSLKVSCCGCVAAVVRCFLVRALPADRPPACCTSAGPTTLGWCAAVRRVTAAGDRNRSTSTGDAAAAMSFSYAVLGLCAAGLQVAGHARG
jgi:hypothetical protein